MTAGTLTRKNTGSVTLGNAGSLTPGNIWCVGRNFADHAREMGASAPGTPMIFLKAGSCAVMTDSPTQTSSGTTAPSQDVWGELQLPPWLLDVHHEVELAVFLGRDLQITHGAVALDLTARSVQAELKKQGHPWTLAKSFPGACPIGSIFAMDQVGQVGHAAHGGPADRGGDNAHTALDWLQRQGELRLTVNGQLRQQGPLREMVFGIEELARYVIEHFPVRPGDALLTGTPAGVGPIHPGDTLVAEIPGLSVGRWRVKNS